MRRILPIAAAAVALVVLVIFLQVSAGAYHSDFTADDDEPAHVVCSLLVYDYAAAGFPRDPVRFAGDYYLHYPKVAIGHWPPLFYAGEAAWMFVFGRDRGALLSFVGVAAAALLLSVFFWARAAAGTLAALAAASALAVIRIMQAGLYAVSPNVVLGLLAFWAAAAWGEYLATRRVRYAWLFVWLALTAIGVHGRGVSVLLIPLTASFFGSRPFWTWWRFVLIPAICVIIVYAPVWLGQADQPSLRLIGIHAAEFFHSVTVTLSWPVLMLAALGAYAGVKRSPRWCAMAGLPLSAWIFHALINMSIEDRYAITAAPGIAVLAALGIYVLGEWALHGSMPMRLAGALFAAVALAELASLTLPLLVKPDQHYHSFIDQNAAAFARQPVFLIAAEAYREGGFIAEFALRERRPEHFILRASKMLASISWSNQDYRLRFSKPEDVAALLDDAHVGYVVLYKKYAAPHAVLLRQALALRSADWSETTLAAQPPDLLLYRRTGAMPPGAPHIVIDMENRIRRSLQTSP